MSIEKGALETQWISQGNTPIGVDEVGRGCIAGPVFAGAAVLDYDALERLSPKEKSVIRDSKTLSQKQKLYAFEILKDISKTLHYAFSTEREIESIGIVPATHLAMRRAINGLCIDEQPVLLAVDGNTKLSEYDGLQETVVKGDNLCYCIAAASIVAKLKRDEWMAKASLKHPHYGFEKHVGYGTKAHLNAIDEYGITPLHRRNFAPIKNMILTSSH